MPDDSRTAVGKPLRDAYHAAVSPPIPPPTTTRSQMSLLRRSDMPALLLRRFIRTRSARWIDLLRDGVTEHAVVREDIRAVTRRIAGDDDHVVVGFPDERNHAVRIVRLVE